MGFPAAEKITPEELLALDCEILIPAALENAITEENAHTIHARIIAEAANGPVTPEADRILDQKGVFLIPDILCNAGGVTVSLLRMGAGRESPVLGREGRECEAGEDHDPVVQRRLQDPHGQKAICGWPRICSASRAWRKPAASAVLYPYAEL